MLFESEYSVKELTRRWDKYTNASNFAGGDDMLDVIFIATRKKTSINLIKKAKTGASPFTTRFRGSIIDNFGKGAIKGSFGKGLLDYLAALLFLLVYSYLCAAILEKDKNTAVIMSVIGVFILFFMLYNSRKMKRSYTNLICKVTGQTTQS